MSVIVSSTYVDGALPHLCHEAQGGTVSASASASGSDPDWLVDGQTFTIWEAAGTSGDVSIDFGSTAQAVGYVGIGAHTFGTQGATVRPSFMLTEGGSYIDATDVVAHTPADDSALLWLFPERMVYGVRLSFSAATAAPYAAVFSAGASLVMPQRSIFTGTPISESDVTTYRHQRSLKGDVLQKTVQGAHLDFEITVQNLSEDFRRGDGWSGFVDHVRGSGTGGFFVSPKPEAYPEDVAFAHVQERPRFVRQTPNKRVSGEVNLSCKGYRAP